MEFLRQIEEKWQKAWEQAKIFEADPQPDKPKCFVTFPYPYMNGPLHMGHAFTATRVDVYARFKRMQGYNVLFPWAWHWTGETIAGGSERIKQGDQSFIKPLLEIDGVPKEELEKFVDPFYMAEYYTRENQETVRKAGFSVDWRREFHTVMPTFQRFIIWQYTRLKEKGYVVRGTHPVVWCPRCESPTGDADRQVGEGVAPEEYTLIKFVFEDGYLPAATFRPETIYAVTNLWINPEGEYVKAKINGEKWIISRKAAEKLKEQKKTVQILKSFKGREIIGKTCESPIDKRKLLILPGWFVDPDHATGVVYSVPAHAPYDWIALKDLQEKPEELAKSNIKPEEVKAIKPISMIKLEGFGEYPAIEISQQLKVKDQHDPKAEEATKILYKKEFHSGVLKEICMEYAGKKVSEVKEQIIRDFKQKEIADSMFDLPQPVVCRCLTPCIVKVLEDQWFLKYSDPEWKEKVRKALNNMEIYPETAKQWFLDVVDWLHEWACARKTGMGTPLPWSKGWIVETLSDSTVYMAFYTINKHIRQHNIAPEKLTPEVFDYIFYGKGSAKQIAEKNSIDEKILKEMHSEFNYWYPVDLRNSAKELVPNHLTFFLYHHTALFPPEQWPKAIGVNGMLMIEGNKMSKSKGNFVTLKSAINDYGADATRLALLLAAEGMDDPDWRKESVRDIRNKLESFYRFVENIVQNAIEQETGHMERWLMSRLQSKIRQVTENIEKMKTRTAAECVFFEIWNDFRWYKRRKGEMKAKILKEALKIWIRLLSPFAPHICEELWNKTGEKPFISTMEWPIFDERKIDLKAEEVENLVKSIMEDTLNIIKATKIKPKRICYYTAIRWKWKIYQKTLETAISHKIETNMLIKELMKDPELKEKAKQVVSFVQKLIKEINQTSPERKAVRLKLGKIDEKTILLSAKEFLEKELKARVDVYDEDNPERYDPKNRAAYAIPYRPAIYME
jgi:leucyl-tRNA synthetase